MCAVSYVHQHCSSRTYTISYYQHFCKIANEYCLFQRKSLVTESERLCSIVTFPTNKIPVLDPLYETWDYAIINNFFIEVFSKCGDL